MNSVKKVPSLRPASLEVGSLIETINEIKRRDLSMSKDDAHIDYISVLDQDDLVKRFSEDLVDMDTRNSLQLRKLYRQIQRQVHCMENDQVANQIIFLKTLKVAKFGHFRRRICLIISNQTLNNDVS